MVKVQFAKSRLCKIIKTYRIDITRTNDIVYKVSYLCTYTGYNMQCRRVVYMVDVTNCDLNVRPNGVGPISPLTITPFAAPTPRRDRIIVLVKTLH